VSSGPISGGRSEISFRYDVTETKDLANVLRAGKLPASADIVQSEVVGPSLGQEATIMVTAIVGLLLVLIWMFIMETGWYANIFCKLTFLFGILASLGAVFCLVLLVSY
jgi:SecD/SecF fusion protein